MRSSDLAFPRECLISCPRLVLLSLNLKKSPPNPNIRFHTAPFTSKSHTPSNFLNFRGFGTLEKKNLLSNSSSSSQRSQFDHAIKTFRNIRSAGFPPDQFAYVNVISACSAAQNFNFGDQFLSLVLKVGFFSNEYVLSGLIDLFSKGGCFLKALDAFLYAYFDNVVCWNAIIAGAVRNGENLIALKLFHRMVGGFCFPNGFTFSSVLSACTAIGRLDIGRGMHALVLKFNEQDDIFVGTSIIDFYAKCGDMDAAIKVFASMPVRNVVSWTALISGFMQKDDSVSALKYFVEMMKNTMDVNVYTITSVLFACGKCFMVNMSYQIHCLILKSGLYTDSVAHCALISTYGGIGNIQMSEKVFEERGTRMHLSTWSAMICSLIQNQCFGRSIELFLQMLCDDLKPGKSCISNILSIVECISFGEQLHTYIVKIGLIDDLLVCSSLFTMYSKCGSIADSYELFRKMPEKDRVAWTSMISGFSSHGNAKQAFQLFREMILEGIEPDSMTLSGALTSCNSQNFLEKGKEIHGFSFRHGLSGDTLIGSSLISMYSKCNNIEIIQRVFTLVDCKDQILWSSLISSYSTNSKPEEAIANFHRMTSIGLQIDSITSSSVLGACAQLSRLDLGRQLHDHAIKAGLVLHNSVVSALVTLYSKCGIISESKKLFDVIQNPDLVTWTSMIEGYAQHGKAKEALKTFDMMKNTGIKPDSITFVSILSTCSHNGLVDEGFSYFRSMSSDYGIEPEVQHYSCMVDLLGRAGRLREAVDLIERMPTEPCLLVWSTLLCACRVYGNIEIGDIARKKMLELENHDSGAHIAVSNMSADMGDWEQVFQIRSSMKEFGLKKEPGWSAL